MPLNPTIRYYSDGEEVDESILNRPLTDIEANLNELFSVTDALPAYTADDAGKYLRINSAGTAYEYTDLGLIRIRTPVAEYPSEGATGVVATVTLQASPYAPIYSVDARNYREFQIDYDGNDFTTPLRSTQVNADDWAVSPDLSEYGQATFIWRCRDVSAKGDISNWSTVQTFTTAAAYVKQPSISVEQDGTKAVRAPLISGSAFEVFGATDTHVNTDWEVVRTSDSVIVWSSYNDATNLTSIQVPDQTLAINTEYNFRARYTGTTYGDSAWGSVTKTTVDYLVKTPTLSTNSTGVEYDDHTVTITNYDASLTYVISVSGGTYTRSAGTITWTLPEVTQDTNHQIDVYAVNGFSEQSSTASKTVLVTNVDTVSDNSIVVTDFSAAEYNNTWSI